MQDSSPQLGILKYSSTPSHPFPCRDRDRLLDTESTAPLHLGQQNPIPQLGLWQGKVSLCHSRLFSEGKFKTIYLVGQHYFQYWSNYVEKFKKIRENNNNS